MTQDHPLPPPAPEGFSDPEEFRLHFAANLNAALDRCGVRKTGFGRVREVSDMFLVSATSAQKWLTGITTPEMWRLPNIAARLNCSISDLFNGLENTSPVSLPDNQPYQTVPFYLAGHLEPVTALLPEGFVARQFGHLRVVEVADDTMEPFVVTGEYVVIANVASLAEILATVVVIEYGGNRIVRRIQSRIAGDTVQLIPENGRYFPEEVSKSRLAFAGDAHINEPDTIRVMGKVVARVLFR